MNQEQRDLFLTALGVTGLAALVILIGWGLSFAVLPASPRELYPGQYAQVDPDIREWFRSQTSPKSGISCCSETDGTYAEEDIREGHYWVRFTWHFNYGSIAEEMQTDWMAVPDDVVIHNPNRHGAPVVWWFWETDTTRETAKVGIRCYAPGGGA